GTVLRVSEVETVGPAWTSATLVRVVDAEHERVLGAEIAAARQTGRVDLDPGGHGDAAVRRDVAIHVLGDTCLVVGVLLGVAGDPHRLDLAAGDHLVHEATGAADVRPSGLALVHHRPALQLAREVAVA